MESQVKISFFLNHSKRTKIRQTPIYLRIRYNYNHVTVSTGYFIAAAGWGKKAKKVKGQSEEASSVNGGLKALEVKVRSVVNQMILQGKPFNVYSIKEALTGSSKQAYTLKDAFETYLSMVKSLIGKDYSPITHGKYNQTYERILEFAKHKYKRICTVFKTADRQQPNHGVQALEQVLSQCLGHSSPVVTISAYSSVLPEMVVKEFKMLRNKLG